MNNYSLYSYEIVWVTTQKDLQKYASLVDDFFVLYEDPSNFPDPDEREEPSFIKDRIAEATDKPHTHLMAYQLISPTGEKQFVAGCIVEFYPDSACALVTYLFVDQAFRGLKIGTQHQKVAETLIQSTDGLVGLTDFFARQYHKPVKAVLFESNNPAQTAAETDSIPPAKRILFFSRLGARRINFDYIQPPLGDGKGMVTNLFLLTFPWLTKLTDTIPVTVVISFVMELAWSLDQNKEPQSVTRYGDEAYYHDRAIVQRLSDTNQTDSAQSELTGLSVNGQNIIRLTYDNLMAQRASSDAVALMDPIT